MQPRLFEQVDAARAAQLEHPPAQCNLGAMLERAGDADGAIELYRKAAAFGLPDAQHNLAECCLLGIGSLEKNEAEAIRLFRLGLCS